MMSSMPFPRRWRSIVKLLSVVASLLFVSSRGLPEIANFSSPPPESVPLPRSVPPPCAPPNSSVVLLTGGAGFIGSWVAEALLRQGKHVVVVDSLQRRAHDIALRRPGPVIARRDITRENTPNLRHLDRLLAEGDVPGSLEFHRISLEDCDAVGELFRRHEFATVIHLAALAGVRRSVEDPLPYVDANVRGTTCMLTHVYDRARTAPEIRFIYASSSSVYGDRVASSGAGAAERPDGEAFLESDHIEPEALRSPYAASKAASELLVHTFHNLHGGPPGARVAPSILRFFTVYGPRGRRDMSPFLFLDAVANGRPVPVNGVGMRRELTFVGDVAAGIIRLAEGRGPPPGGAPRTYNIAGGRVITVEEMLEQIHGTYGRLAGKQQPLTIERKPVPPGDVPFTRGSIERAREDFGYAPNTTFERGIEEMVRWYLDDYEKDGF
ncbi:hypothetical protein DFJ74DRAFT_86651 [Hyaloraphidium curvatum]|nr:hypothetical protein DFJ74DRAFT_86651 [Hyaloraphidium curvatum]